ncbi:MAG: hypothetical protein WA849_11365 [Candidatus Udaeobacter sp.]
MLTSSPEFSADSASLKRILNQAEDFPRQVPGSSRPAIAESTRRRNRKGNIYELNDSAKKVPLLFLVASGLACFGLVSLARADCREGCDILNRNTLLGVTALVNNTTGTFNTANGCGLLADNTTGTYNTAIGTSALKSNNSGSDNTATVKEQAVQIQK